MAKYRIMSQLTTQASEAFDALLDATNLTDRACSEIMALRHGLKWSRGSVNAKRRGTTPLSLDDISDLAEFFGVPTGFFFMTRHERLKWLGETRWCAPWELNPEPAAFPRIIRQIPGQGILLEPTWDGGGSSVPPVVMLPERPARPVPERRAS